MKRLINLPAAAASFVVTAVFLDVHNPHTNLREGIMVFDWSGTMSLLAMVLLVLLGLDFGGETFPWTSPKVLCLILVGTFVSLFFVVNERKVARLPLLPPRLFKSASSVACFGLAFAHGIVCFLAQLAELY